MEKSENKEKEIEREGAGMEEEAVAEEDIVEEEEDINENTSEDNVEKTELPLQSKFSEQKNEKGNTTAEKKIEAGLIYISYVPPGMTPKFVETIFKQYGEVGNIWMKPAAKQKKNVKPKFDRGNYVEGWIEIKDKKLARRLAISFNNTPISDGKQNKFANYLWNVKYLPRIRWNHLVEKMTFEREKRKQMMRVEFAQAKKETEIYKKQVEENKKLMNIRERKMKKGEEWKVRKSGKIKQRKTLEEMQAAKKRKNPQDHNEATKNKVLRSIFG